MENSIEELRKSIEGEKLELNRLSGIINEMQLIAGDREVMIAAMRSYIKSLENRINELTNENLALFAKEKVVEYPEEVFSVIEGSDGR